MSPTSWNDEMDQRLLGLVSDCRKGTQIDWCRIAKLMRKYGLEWGNPMEEEHDRLYRGMLRRRYRKLTDQQREKLRREQEDAELFEKYRVIPTTLRDD